MIDLIGRSDDTINDRETVDRTGESCPPLLVLRKKNDAEYLIRKSPIFATEGVWSYVKSSHNCSNTWSLSFRKQSVSTSSSWSIRKQQEGVAGCTIMHVNRHERGCNDTFLTDGETRSQLTASSTGPHTETTSSSDGNTSPSDDKGRHEASAGGLLPPLTGDLLSLNNPHSPALVS